MLAQSARWPCRWGTITGEIGSRDESKEILKTAVRHFERLRVLDRTDVDVLIGLARSYQDLSYNQVFTNQPEEGLQSARQAAAVWPKVIEAQPGNPEWPTMLGRTHDLMGIALAKSAADFAGAKSEFRQAIEILTAAADRFPGQFETQRRLGRTLQNLAEALLMEGDLDGSLNTNIRAVAVLKVLVNERPTSLLLLKDMASKLGGLAKSRMRLGFLRLAEVDFKESCRTIDEIVSANPKVIEYLEIQAETYLYLGLVQAQRGETEQARADLLKVIGLERGLLKQNPTLRNSLESLPEGSAYLAGVERETGRFDLAAKHCDESLAITESDDKRALLQSVWVKKRV